MYKMKSKIFKTFINNLNKIDSYHKKNLAKNFNNLKMIFNKLIMNCKIIKLCLLNNKIY